MAINYSMTKESERELRKGFFKYYDHVYKSWKELADVYKKTGDISDINLEKFFNYEDQSNMFEADMLEECIWHISRNTPVASHLRFIISIVYSISDLERMADYVISIARYLNQNKIKEKAIVKIISDSICKSVAAMDKIVALLRKPDNVNEHWITTYRLTMKYAEEFKKEFDNNMASLIKVAYNKNSAEEAGRILSGASMLLKNVERNVDHSTNLVENFVYIKNADFFRSKRSKQASKLNLGNENMIGTLIQKEPIQRPNSVVDKLAKSKHKKSKK